METAVIAATAAFVSLLTFFSGFGLATVLTPVMLVFYPPQVAITLTAIVHFLNNVFKYLLTRRHVDWRIVFRFGVPAAVGAFIGAEILSIIPGTSVLYSYTFLGKICHLTGLKLVLAGLMIFFALFETIPRLKNLRFGADKIYLGGFLSGFFGGLSGHQGALRSAFLIRSGLSKETFIATGIVVACIVDMVRLVVYQPFSGALPLQVYSSTIIPASLAAFTGALIGNLLLRKITIGAVQTIVAAAVIILALALGVGMV